MWGKKEELTAAFWSNEGTEPYFSYKNCDQRANEAARQGGTPLKYAGITIPNSEDMIVYRLVPPDQFEANERTRNQLYADNEHLRSQLDHLRFQLHIVMAILATLILLGCAVYSAYRVYVARRKRLTALEVPLSSAFCSIQNQSFSIMSKYLHAEYSLVKANCNKIIGQVPVLLKKHYGSSVEDLLRSLSEVKTEDLKCKKYMESKAAENLPDFVAVSLDDHKKVFEEDCRMIDKFRGKVEELRVLMSTMKEECREDQDSGLFTRWYPKVVEHLSAGVQFVREYLGMARVDRKEEKQTAKDVPSGFVGNNTYHETAFESKSHVVRHESPMSSMNSNVFVPSSDNSQLRQRGFEPLTKAWNESQSWDGPLLGTVSGDDVITRPPSVASSVTSQWSVVEDYVEEEKQE